MTYWRMLVTVLVLTGAAVLSSHATVSASPAGSSGACTPDALSRAFTGPFRLQSIDSFGCSGAWAYVWATVGSGPQEIGVTEVLRHDVASESWRFVSRQQYCHPGLIPDFIYRKGCFSN